MKSSVDQDATARLVRWVHDHGGAVRGFLCASLGDSHAADDLLQETFCRAWTARERYRDDGRERAYLLRIADRLVCDRRRKRRETLLDEDAWFVHEPIVSDDLPLEELERLETTRELHDALTRLSEPQRRTLLLRFFGNLEFHEIGELLEMPVNTVLSHGRRGLLTLRKILTEKSP